MRRCAGGGEDRRRAGLSREGAVGKEGEREEESADNTVVEEGYIQRGWIRAD